MMKQTKESKPENAFGKKKSSSKGEKKISQQDLS
jgi:hypothetical protein